MNELASPVDIARAILASPQILRVKPSVSWFLCRYLRKFKVRKVGKNLILHSHLPALNSTAYRRFIREHLLNDHAGPSHAQIGLTNACPQHCSYCYNKSRSGAVMDTLTIKQLICDLKRLGVFWLGLTGGEPLLNRDIVSIVESVGTGCAVKLFTTGCTLTRQRAVDLQRAGLYSVSVSLDHWDPEVHDRGRGYPGAFQSALRAIRIFQEVGGIDVGVSAVLPAAMIRKGETERFLAFLKTLDIHEAWLSEAKPSVPGLWDSADIITEQERQQLVALQDRWNASGEMTVNYLAHFEGKEHFGCCAGHKMLYVDPFGSVSPCVFTPMSFGNVRERSIEEIFWGMRRKFPTEGRCFINHNYRLLQQQYGGNGPVEGERLKELMAGVRFAPYAKFFQLHYAHRAA